MFEFLHDVLARVTLFTPAQRLKVCVLPWNLGFGLQFSLLIDLSTHCSYVVVVVKQPEDFLTIISAVVTNLKQLLEDVKTFHIIYNSISNKLPIAK